MARHSSRHAGGRRHYYSCETHRKDRDECGMHKVLCLVKQKSTENLSIFDTLDEHAEAYLSCGLFFPFPSISAFSIL